MATMTWDQKERRREARRAGQQVVTALAHMETALREAHHWYLVKELEQEMFWRGRANTHATTAEVYARTAARAALQSIAEAS